jgi:hypothetical protein
MFQMQVHGNDLTSFYEQVPKHVLPKEYGGDFGSVSEIWGMIMLFHNHLNSIAPNFYLYSVKQPI